jgi:hypothetical protein
MRSLPLTLSPVLLLCGCLSGGGGMPAPTNNDLTLFPTTVYTGVEAGGPTYAVPIAASGATGMSWSSSDVGVVTVTGNDTEALVDGAKDGMATVTAKAGTQSASAMIVVTSYTAAQRMAGAQSFTKYNCGGCHASVGADISPSGIGKHSDAQVLAAATQGANPEGGDISIGKAAHSFAADPGIVAYVRSLAPAGVPHADD